MDLECSICLDSLLEKDSDGQAQVQAPPKKKVKLDPDAHNSSALCNLPCGHVFHRHCITSWLETSSTCPSCEVEVQLTDAYPIYLPVREREVEVEEPEDEDKGNQGLAEWINSLEERIQVLEWENQSLMAYRDQQDEDEDDEDDEEEEEQDRYCSKCQCYHTYHNKGQGQDDYDDECDIEFDDEEEDEGEEEEEEGGQEHDEREEDSDTDEEDDDDD